MRFTSASYLAPYLSQTGFTASWNCFLSAKVITSMPASLIFFDRLRLALVPELALLLLRLGR